MTDWRQLHERAADQSEDLGQLRRRVDLVSVCLQLGVELEEKADDRWEGRCPFHDDARPSFAVWWDSDDGCQRCGCWSCDFGTGDVFDLVQRANDVPLRDAVAWAREHADDEPLRPPESAAAAPAEDLGALAQAAIARATGSDEERLQAFLVARGVRAPASWIRDRFWVGIDELGRVVIPHGTPDGQVHAVKRRAAPAWVPIAVRGSRLEHLYGAHLLGGQPRVVVVEGESDTWSVAWLLRDDPDVCVLGLPHGAGPGKPPRSEWVAQLVDRDVTLLFDADQAGRAGLRAWVEALPRVRVAQLAEGQDATSAGPAAVDHALAHTIYHGDDWPPALEHVPGGLVTKAEKPKVVANFWLELERLVEIDGEELVFEVRLPDRRHVLLSSYELGSEQRLRGWVNRHGYVWYGNARDAQELMRMLTLDAAFVPRVPGTRVAGWYDGTFVLPDAAGGPIGPRAWAYVPPVADVNLPEKLALEEGAWDHDVPALLRRLHQPDVVTPILGWVAAAPLRALCHQFPVLAVVGGAGTGKTTLVGVLLRAFGFKVSSMLTATTPHAVHSLAASTNAIPVWFDEFRAGARADARLVLEQVIRDAWDGGASLKGGLRDNRQELVSLRASAPLVVSGEDAFSETSHLERMVLVNMPADGREPGALARLGDEQQVQGLGRAYLEWLVDQHQAGTLPRPPHVLDRMQQARAVVLWGWELFHDFTLETCGYSLGALDLRRVERAHTEAIETPQIIEILSHFLGVNCSRGFPLVWTDGPDACVRVTDVVRAAQRETDLPLPGGSRAVRNWLVDRYLGSEERNAWGRYTRLRGAAADVGG